MKKWIRWQGIFPFIIIIAVLGISWVLFSDLIVKNVIERAGTQTVGAKVELQSADISFFPARLKLKKLQVTDPEKPMTNAIECAEMDFAIELIPILKNKIIIDNLITTGMQFGSQRETSGAIENGKKKGAPEESSAVDEILDKTGCGKLDMPKLEAPDVKKILGNENLGSIKVIQSFESDVNKEQSKWQSRLNTLPDEKKFNEYQKKMDALQKKKKGVKALLGSANEILNLKKEIERDIQKIKSAKKNLNSTLKSYQLRMSKLSKSPLEDIRQLSSKYALSPEGISNLSNLIFGEQFCGAIKKCFMWYERLKPYLAKIPKKDEGEKEPEVEIEKPIRGKGVFVKFKEKAPLPDFLIRKTSLNVILSKGDITGTIQNITNSQAILGSPTTFEFLGKEMKDFALAEFQGSLNFIDASFPKHEMMGSIKRYAFNDFKLSEDQSFPLSLNNALADMNITASFLGKDLKANFNSKFDEVKLALTSAMSENSSQILKALGASLGSVETFDLFADLKSDLSAYDFKIHSDLDSILKNSVGKLVQQEMEKFEQQLKANIMKKIDGPLKNAQKSLKTLGPIEDQISKRLNLGQGLLKKDLFKKVKLPLFN